MSNLALKIRTIKESDYEDLLELWKRAGLHLKTISDSFDGFSIMIRRNPETCLVGLLDNKIIASVLGGFDGRRGYIWHLAVDPQFQKKGYGKQMMEAVENKFKEMGVVKIHLTVERTNASVVSFYKHLNWYIRDDLIMMSKDLIDEKTLK